MTKDEKLIFEAYEAVQKAAWESPDKGATFDAMVKPFGFTLADPADKVMGIIKGLCRGDADAKNEAYELLQVIFEGNRKLFDEIFAKRWEQIKF